MSKHHRDQVLVLGSTAAANERAKLRKSPAAHNQDLSVVKQQEQEFNSLVPQFKPKRINTAQ